MKCILINDLTRYHPSLKEGVEGNIVGDSRLGDRFRLIAFPEVTIDVLFDSYRTVGEVQIEKSFKEALLTARRAVKIIGPRGGFRRIQFDYVKDGLPCYYSSDDPKIENLLKQNGIPIKASIER